MNETLKIWLIMVGVLLAIVTIAAGLIYIERRLLAMFQDRLGPNRVGPAGLFQVLADMVKIFLKEDWIPPFADKPVFIMAPAVALATAMMSFAIIPFAPGLIVSDIHVGLLFFLAMSSLSAYSVILGGWASNNRYAMLGAMRGSAQTLTYEVFMGISLMGVVMMTGSFSLVDIVEAQRKIWFVIPQFVGFVIFFIAGWQKHTGYRLISLKLRMSWWRDFTRSIQVSSSGCSS
jgi:NADH-quinone oxidoreductase subunit H